MPLRVTVLIAVLSLPCLLWRTGAQAPPPSSTHNDSALSRPIGSLGCSATGCHGNHDARSLTAAPDAACWKSSYTHWRAVDPHSKAYAALQTPLAKDIVDRLAKGDPSWASTMDSRCLACHTNPALASVGAASRLTLQADALNRLRSEGVSCEACHGNASKWLVPHLQWKTPADREADHARVGFSPLYDLGQRALTCAGCHVGAAEDSVRGYPTRDMNHEMIAAGHPRLNFDFMESQRRLTPHWLETNQDPKSPGEWRDVHDEPGVDSRSWLIGQAAKAEAASRLLADRAARSSTTSWPEFAESNCFACHHDLQPESWRRETLGAMAGRAAGSLSWQPLWPFKVTTTEHDLPVWKGQSELRALERLLASARPDASKVQPAALALANQFRATREALGQQSEASALDLLRDLLLGHALAGSVDQGWPFRALQEGERDHLQWDEAAQAYLAFRAFQRDRERWIREASQPLDSQTTPVLRALGQALMLPRSENGANANSPVDYSPQNVRALFRQLRNVIPRDERYELQESDK